MKRVLAGILTACVLAAVLADAQALSPYKLGTFARGGRLVTPHAERFP